MSAIIKYVTKIISSAKSILLFIFLLTSIFAQPCFAQFSVDTQFRNRFEIRDGYRKLAEEGSTPAAFISQRTRISFNYENDLLKLKITPQDVRVWGDEQLSSSTGVFGDDASLELFEAYVQIKTGANGSLTVGRQPLIYDNQRIFATRNWNQNGIAYDAVVYKWKSDDWEVHAGSSWNSTGQNSTDNYYDPDRIKSLNLFWLKHTVSESWNVSLSHVASGVTKTETDNKLYFKQTSGIFSDYTKDRWKILANYYYQFGKNNTEQKVQAHLATLDVTYKIANSKTGVGVTYLSGNKTVNGGTDRLFDVLYGARHRYFGEMDYFSNFGSNTNQGGLVDYYYNFEFSLNSKTTLKNTGHYFCLAQTNETTPDDKKLGYENDFIVTYKFAPWGLLDGGYMFFLPTASLKDIQSVSETKFSQFFYLQLTVTPVLFKN